MRTDIRIFDFRCSMLRFSRVFGGARILCDVLCLQQPETMTTRRAPASITSGKLSSLMPPMQKIGNANGLVNVSDLVQSDRRVIGLCRRGKERAEADVVSAFVESADLPGRRCGSIFRPDNLGPAISRASAIGRIVLPDVNPFRRHDARDLGMIVDDQRNSLAAVMPCSSAANSAISRRRISLSRATG